MGAFFFGIITPVAFIHNWRSEMTLILHTGASEVDFDQLRRVDTPAATSSHVPLPHHDLVEMVRYALGFYEHEILEEHHAIMPDGQRYFGLMTLKSPYGDYTDTLGLRNSHDKSWPVGLAFGSRVFVCDNTAFSAETIVKRKHTANARRELPAIIADIVQPLSEKRLLQANTFERYKHRALELDEFDHLVIELYRRGAINVTRIADVVDAYENPPFDWGDPTAWRAFNAVTYALRGRVAENPQATQTLHNVVDALFEPVEPDDQLKLPHLAAAE